MGMRKFVLYILIPHTMALVFGQESWNTNVLDYSFNNSARTMVFRQPITFSPFEIKAGYFHYGGVDYLNNFSLFPSNINSHPVILDSTHTTYDGLQGKKDRQGIFVEVDFLKTNILLHLIPQNIFDIHFGLGYRMSHMLNNPDLPNDITYPNPNENWQEYKFSPKIHDFNFNTTIQWQFNQLVIPYIYHSIGFSKISLYKTEANRKYLYGNAISETFAFGIKKIISYEQSNRYNLYYGFEFKSLRTTTISLKDPQQFSPITGFDMRGVNLNLTFGVIFGGKKTIGDEAFSMLIHNDIENAIPAFEEYIENYPKHGKIKKAKKMLSFCKQQLPYKNYKIAMKNLDDQKIDDAIIYLNDAYAYADDSLKVEINLTKETLAKEMMLDFETNFNEISIKDCEKKLNFLSELSPSIKDEIKIMKAELFLRKATLLHESNLLIDALRYYQIALSYNDKLLSLINKRMESLINGIINKSSEYQEKNEIILTIETLKIAIEIDQKLSYKLNPTISILEEQVQQIKDQKTRQIMHEIIEENKSKGNTNNKDLIIGMTKDRVIDYISMPDQIEFITSSLDAFEIWIYNESNRKLFFKNDKLYHIQNIED